MTTPSTDLFAHHAFLDTVVQEDVRYLREKDKSYGASWKLSGGRSAWFMLRRKMDRMITMLARPEAPAEFDPNRPNKNAHIAHLAACYNAEDIFAKITERPGGEDGSVLAEVRDLRRYLTLVEAEMIARGVVAPPAELHRNMREAMGPDGRVAAAPLGLVKTAAHVQPTSTTDDRCEWAPGRAGP